MIASPVVAKRSTLTLHKIVGVIFDSGKHAAASTGEMEIADCGGEFRLSSAVKGAKGLVEVFGHSAEPHALDKQLLIIGESVSLANAEKTLDGRPVIVEDSNNSRYFKRLRIDDDIILESLEIGGDFPPVVLARSIGAKHHVAQIWPVLGVLFEKPN